VGLLVGIFRHEIFHSAIWGIVLGALAGFLAEILGKIGDRLRK
jgi:F0F1-type ATP synthase assembly protein I